MGTIVELKYSNANNYISKLNQIDDKLELAYKQIAESTDFGSTAMQATWSFGSKKAIFNTLSDSKKIIKKIRQADKDLSKIISNLDDDYEKVAKKSKKQIETERWLTNHFSWVIPKKIYPSVIINPFITSLIVPGFVVSPFQQIIQSIINPDFIPGNGSSDTDNNEGNTSNGNSANGNNSNGNTSNNNNSNGQTSSSVTKEPVFSYGGKKYNIPKGFDTAYAYNQYDPKYNGSMNSACSLCSMATVLSMVKGEKITPEYLKANGYWNSNGAIWKGNTSITNSGYRGMYDSIVNKDKPCVIRLSGTGTHYVAAVGIREGADPNNLTSADILTFDPAKGKAMTLAEVEAYQRNIGRKVDGRVITF